MTAVNQMGMYDVADRYIAEIYDRTETQQEDVSLILSLLGSRPARVLEPFCGHGRILIPLAEAGHEVVGLDLSEHILHNLSERLEQLPSDVRGRATWHQADVMTQQWPVGFEAVILGANCFYELATPQEQEHCIRAAAQALVPGGLLYLDNNHMEGRLDPSWTQPGVTENAFPTGMCEDGTRVTSTMETIWHDAEKRLVRFRRTTTIRTPDGTTVTKEYEQQKHPPSTQEMAGWLQ